MSLLDNGIFNNELVQQISFSDFNFVELDQLVSTGEQAHDNYLNQYFNDNYREDFSRTFDNSHSVYPHDDLYATENRGHDVSFEACMPIHSAASYQYSCVDIFEDAAAEEAVVVLETGQDKDMNNNNNDPVESAVESAEVPLKKTTFQQTAAATSAVNDSKKVRRCDQPLLFQHVAPASVAPTHFEVKRQSRIGLLYTIRDHFHNNHTSYEYSPSDCTFRATLADTEESCVFEVRLYATAECREDDDSTYVVEASHVYGDQHVFASAYSALRSGLLCDKTAAVLDGYTVASMKAVEQSHQTADSRDTTAEKAAMNIIDNKTSIDSNYNGVVTMTQQRPLSLADVAKLYESSLNRSMINNLLELGVVSQLLCIFRPCCDASEYNDNDGDQRVSGAVNTTTGTVSVNVDLITMAIKTLRNMAHDQRVRLLLVDDKAFLTFVYDHVVTRGDSKEGTKLIRESNDASLKAACREVLSLLCAHHSEQVRRQLNRESIAELVSCLGGTRTITAKTQQSQLPQQQPMSSGCNKLRRSVPVHSSVPRFSGAVSVTGGLVAPPLSAIPTK